MRRKHALRKAREIARNINKSAYLWRTFDPDQEIVSWVATPYCPPKGWARKWAEISPAGEVEIIKV